MLERDKQLIDRFLKKLYGDNSSKHTVDNYRVDLNFYLEFLRLEDLTITDVTLDDLEGYKAYLRDATYGDGKNYSENTRARRISSLKSFYNYLHDRDIVDRNPTHKLKIPKTESGSDPIFMTQKQAIRLINATEGELHEKRDKAMITLFLTTGMRLSELVNLDITDITGTQITIRQGKGNKTRTVNTDKNTMSVIKDYIKHNNYSNGEALFTSQRSSRIGVQAVQFAINKYIKKAKLDSKLSVHKLRHTAAVLMLRNKVDLNTIKEFLGHSSLSTTQIYVHTLDETKQEAANVMGGLFAQ